MGRAAIRGRSVSLPTRARGDIILVAVDAGDRPVAYGLLEAGWACRHALIVIPITQDRALPGNCSPGSRPMQGQPEPPGCSPKRANLPGRFFARAGFRLVRRRDFTIPHAGGDIAIHNYAMEKSLA